MDDSERAETTPSTGGSLWWIWIIVAILVIAVVAFFVVRSHRASDTSTSGPGAKGGPRGAVPVVVSKARRGELNIFLDGLGTVTPLNTVAVHSRVDGQLDKVLFTEGQIVNAGDLLVQIDQRPFQVQLTQAQGTLIRDQALLADAQVNLDRYKSLLTQNLSITKAQVDTQQALVYQYDGAVKTDQGMIDSAKLNITYCNITAPLNGRVGLRLVDQGNIVHATDVNPLVIVSQIQPITVVFTIAEDYVARIMQAIAKGEPLTVEAWDRDLKSKLADGTLLAVDNQVDPTNGTVKIKAVFKNEHIELFPNEFVNARLQIDTLKNVILIPAAGVQRGPNNTFVYVVVPDGEKPTEGTVTIRPVTIGPTEGDKTVIESGLTAGDIVVTDGVDKLQEKTKVSMKSRATKSTGATQPTTKGADEEVAGKSRHASGTHPVTRQSDSTDPATQPVARHHPRKNADQGAEQ